MIYLDEAGISNPAQEPYVVVAGVVVHADKQWKAVEQYLSDMADKYVRPEDRKGFVFHATELFSGGKVFRRKEFSKEQRWAILDELVSIPEKFDLPIVYGRVDRAGLESRYPKSNLSNLTIAAQGIAFTVCAHGVEYWMERMADDDEVALMIMENNNQARATIRSTHQYLRDPRNLPVLEEQGLTKLALTRIVDTVFFAEKGHSSPLQIADACAFVIKRHHMNKPDSGRFYDPLVPYLVMRHKSESGNS